MQLIPIAHVHVKCSKMNKERYIIYSFSCVYLGTKKVKESQFQG